ncbi:MAG TPA: HEAT repeat domain-containing protein [Bacteroidota bacterium]|nr:HEAT repeat domain-containing protein [Bacteroidota bacterium]
MKHRQWRELIQLSVAGELNAEQQEALDNHVKGCTRCREELSGVRRLASAVTAHPPLEVTDELLGEARRQLRAALLERRLKVSFLARARRFVGDFILEEYRVALGGAFMLLVGAGIGYSVFHHPQISSETARPVEPAPVQQVVRETVTPRESFTQGDTRTANVRMIDADGTDGNVEFTFDAITPMHVRGNINDEKVQKVLARALMTEDNPGVRIKTVNAIGSQLPSAKAPDPGIKTALLSALRNDDNPGVRQEALRVLLRYPFDREIRDALVYTLGHDKNSGMRIAAVNGLAVATLDGHEMNQDVLEVLKKRMHSDDNNYVRRQAQTVLEEVSHR